MLGAERYALSIFLLAILFLIVSSHTGTAANKAIVPANAPVNLGAGSGVEQPFSPRFMNLAPVAAEEWGWKRHAGIATDHRSEPVHENSWKFVNEAAAQTSDPGAPSKIPAEPKESTKKSDSKTPAKVQTPPAGKTARTAPPSKASPPAKSVAPVDDSLERKMPPVKSPSILQMLEGHETELTVATTIAVAFFIIGWICGGNYHLRRDRRRRTKIRF
jgi:hypothetical protein